MYSVDGYRVYVDASASCSFDGELTYLWDFGDGSPVAEGMIGSHTYSKSGEYEVKLTVIDESDEATIVKRVIQIQ